MYYEYSLDTGFLRNDGQLHPIVIPEKAGIQRILVKHVLPGLIEKLRFKVQPRPLATKITKPASSRIPLQEDSISFNESGG